MELEEIIKGCIRYEPIAQRYLYNCFAPIMRVVCNRYANSKDDAQDILQEGFVKVYLSISRFDGTGSFEGWMKRIMINTALTHFKKNKNWFQKTSIDSYIEDSDLYDQKQEDDLWEKFQDLDKEVLLGAIQSLPDVYRIVFNMYFIEDMKHKEISELLNIDENTSRTRLLRAKKMIKKKLEEIVSNTFTA